SYWKLYAVENTLRVVINSVLSAQINPNWWPTAADPRLISNVARFRAQYTAKPRHASPGGHDIYLVFLSDLNQIIRINSHQFRPLIPDIDRWIARLEGIRLPRNLVGHMNFPNHYDRQRIDNTYDKLPALLSRLRNRGIPILIP
ncbi:MAG: hypothetical protein ACLPTQ_06490, partial [Terriglobales bacterium]